MSNESVPMVCATSVMKPGGTRVGHIVGNWSLPRTVALSTLVGVGVGVVVAMAGSLVAGGDFQTTLFAMAFGGAGGWLVVNYSPLEGETLWTWAMLKFRTQTRARFVNGRRVTLAVGTAVVEGPSSGTVLLLRSALRVTASQYDERGVLRSVENQNLDDDTAIVDPALVVAARGDTTAYGARHLPGHGPLDETAQTPARRSRRAAALGPMQ